VAAPRRTINQVIHGKAPKQRKSEELEGHPGNPPSKAQMDRNGGARTSERLLSRFNSNARVINYTQEETRDSAVFNIIQVRR
jgi:hypothetical protein